MAEEDSVQGSRNPANSEDLGGALLEILNKFMASNIDDMLPCIVIAYDRLTNRATVKPLIRKLKTDNTLKDRQQIASVPCLNIGGGNAVLSFNIIPGDIGWIKASDRDISLFLQSMEEAGPNTLRIHDFGDGLFIPDKFRNWTLAEEDEAFCVLQTTDGLNRIALWDDRIKITTPILEVDAVNANFSGKITAVGLITGSDFTDGTTVYSTHLHAQDDDGAGDSEADTDEPKAP